MQWIRLKKKVLFMIHIELIISVVCRRDEKIYPEDGGESTGLYAFWGVLTLELITYDTVASR